MSILARFQAGIMIKADIILFDLDGTLVDSAPDLLAANNHVLKGLGMPALDLASIRMMVGEGARAMLLKSFAHYNYDKPYDIEALFKLFIGYYEAHMTDHSRLYSGAEDLLKNLKSRGYKLGLCTNKSLGLAKKLIHNLQIAPYFDIVTGGDSFSFRKPDPRHLDETAKLIKSDYQKNQLLMIGDSISDIAAARSLQIASIAVDYGYSAMPASLLGADHVVSDLSAIKALIF